MNARIYSRLHISLARDNVLSICKYKYIRLILKNINTILVYNIY